ncbi:MAG: hypothetical protein EOP45_22640 [Sphingobacteriaceae bacterium]|nr:MAG: hypothetical protein EOP45_22640 [Sphingobacteriaceae bacterium]
MKNIIVIGLAALIVIFNALIGHFFAPNGILLIPLVLAGTTSLITFGTTKINVIWISVLCFLVVSLNDLLIKFYSGGLHDSEGQGWIHMLLFVGLIPTTIVLLISIFRQKEATTFHKIIAVIIFPILLMMYLHLFSDFGLKELS